MYSSSSTLVYSHTQFIFYDFLYVFELLHSAILTYPFHPLASFICILASSLWYIHIPNLSFVIFYMYSSSLALVKPHTHFV